MKTFVAAILIVGTGLTGAAIAHPTNVPFDSYGECIAELHQQNKVDRDRVGSFFPNKGAAAVSMIDDFSCEYDPDTDAWYFAGAPMTGSNLGNGNGKANPGSNIP